MTRNEKIGLLENYSTFLAANGYMDEDWRSEPPYAIDEFLKLTVPESVPSCGAKSVIEERLLNAFYKALQWDGGEITGIDMKTLEQRVHGILTKH